MTETTTDWTCDRAAAVPGSVPGALERYVNQGIDPGDFLRAVLENDLREAYSRADEYSKDCLQEIVELIYTLPMACRGSREAVKEWMISGGLRGIQEMNE